jgi:ATP-dependent Clp protease adaptor protein ClpS
MPDPNPRSSPDVSSASTEAPSPTLESKPQLKARSRNRNKPKQLPPYNVILLNDDDHTYEYVIRMLGELFAFPAERGYQLAKVVDKEGRAILLTTHRELAELKQEQIHAYGTDTRVATCKGSMSAIIEPAS